MEAIRQEKTGRLVGIKEFTRYCGLGQVKARELGKDIGARVEIGSRVLYDLRKADDYFDRITGRDTGDKVKAMY